MLELHLKPEELKELNNDKDKIRDILVARAIYNESENVEFSKEDEMNVWFIHENNLMQIYMNQEVENRITFSENEAIKIYNENKEKFDEQKISFKDAREMIINDLKQKAVYEQSQALVKKLVDELEDEVSLTKDELQFSHGDPEVIKLLVLIKILNKNAKKTDFFERNKEIIEIDKINARINFYTQVIVRNNLNVTQEMVDEVFDKEKENLKDIPEVQAKQYIADQIAQQQSLEIYEGFRKYIIEKYNIEKLIEENLG